MKKKCPFCQEEVKEKAVKCPFCQEKLTTESAKKKIKKQEIEDGSDMIKGIGWFMILSGVFVLISTIDGEGHLNCGASCIWTEYLGINDFKCVWPIPWTTMVWRFIYCPILIFFGWQLRGQSTKNNSTTRKGRRKAVAKKAPSKKAAPKAKTASAAKPKAAAKKTAAKKAPSKKAAPKAKTASATKPKGYQ